jgi:hypothetical protein
LKNLKIAYLHYHLKPGGVTTVIGHQVAAVSSFCETLILSSQKPPNNRDMGTEVSRVPLLAYDREIKESFSASQLAESIASAIYKKWPDGCDVLHVHNPTLAKNKKLLNALEILRDKGIHLFMQIHDFAEDGRPDVYYSESYVGNVHYGVINSRDYDLLLKAGLKEEGLHLIGNRILPFEWAEPDPQNTSKDDAFVLYPVRAIRRKNIGEVLLLSLFMPEKEGVGITLPPNSPGDTKAYRHWQNFILQHRFNVKLEMGLRHDFHALVRNATYFITTSVNEGFGFSFLEPWTAGKMVFGRLLPHVCRDFIARGVDLNHLYEGLYVPLDAIEPRGIKGRESSFFSRWQQALLHNAEAFGCRLDPGRVKDAFQQLSGNGVIDFAVLDQTAQMMVLENVIHDDFYRRQVVRLNSWLDRTAPFTSQIQPETVAHNNDVVRDQFGKQRYADTLLKIYRDVTRKTVLHSIDKQILLNAFLEPLEFKMLKWKEK